MRTIRTVWLLSVAIVCLLTGAWPSAAKTWDEILNAALSETETGIDGEQTSVKTCDKVLYIAYDGRRQYEYLFTERIEYNKIVKFPHYVGAVCLDTVNEKLKFYSQDAEFPANPLVDALLRAVLFDNYPRLHIYPVKKKKNNGDGLDIGMFIGSYHLWEWPEDVKSLSERVAFVLEGGDGFKIIRREVNAEPDLKWTPKFKQTRYHHELGSGPNVYDWTD